MTSDLGIEPGPHWWKASALTTVPTLHLFYWLFTPGFRIIVPMAWNNFLSEWFQLFMHHFEPLGWLSNQFQSIEALVCKQQREVEERSWSPKWSTTSSDMADYMETSCFVVPRILNSVQSLLTTHLHIFSFYCLGNAQGFCSLFSRASQTDSNRKWH